MSLNKCKGNFNVIDDPSERICIWNKTEDVNVKAFNKVLARINETKTYMKRILCNGACKFDAKECTSNEKLNSDKCRWGYKKPIQS